MRFLGKANSGMVSALKSVLKTETVWGFIREKNLSFNEKIVWKVAGSEAVFQERFSSQDGVSGHIPGMP